MSKQRKTKQITYNLYDRGRKHTGIDRSNVDMKAMISLLRSNEVQETIKSGQWYGYFGHEIRARYGMVPPDAVPIDGKMVPLVPASRTLELRVDDQGNVTHRQEFLENEPGEYARQQYLAKVGGFSTAVNYRQTMGGGLTPVSAFGFDYVIQPNYVSNSADGALFDGLFIQNAEEAGLIASFDSATDIASLDPQRAFIANLLERQVLQQFDSINQHLALMQNNQYALDQIHLLDLQLRKKEIQAQRQEEYRNSMISEISSFDSVVDQATRIVDQLNQATDAQQSPKTGILQGVRKIFTFGG